MTDWNVLWANELTEADLRPAQIVMFMKSSYWLRRPPNYAFTDALISALDLTPFTHAALVTPAEGEDQPWIAHSEFRGILHEPLEQAAYPHRFGDLFVFEAQHISPESALAVCETARAFVQARPDEDLVDTSYPFPDMFFHACLMRLRSRTRFDSQLHRRIAGVTGRLTVRRGHRGRLCTPFVASAFAEAGVPLAAPSERAAHESGIVGGIRTTTPLQTEEGLERAAGLFGTLKDDLVQLLDDLTPGPTGAGTERFRGIVENLDRTTTQRRLVEWLLAPGDPHDDITVQLVAALEQVEGALAASPPSDLGERFFSCHDLLLSESVRPVGHVRMWHKSHNQKKDTQTTYGEQPS